MPWPSPAPWVSLVLDSLVLPWRLGHMCPPPQDICGTAEDEGVDDPHPQTWWYCLKYVHWCVNGLRVVPLLGLWKSVIHS